MMNQQDARGEGLAVRERLAAADPAAQRLKGFHELLIGIRGAIERPALAEQTPAGLVLGGNFETERGCCFLRDRRARRCYPHARQRAAKAGILQRLTRGVAILAVADQQEFKTSGPVGDRRTIDVPGRDIESLPLALHQTVKTVAAHFSPLEPAVPIEPRHLASTHTTVDVDGLKELQQRAEPDRATARHDRIAE